MICFDLSKCLATLTEVGGKVLGQVVSWMALCSIMRATDWSERSDGSGERNFRTNRHQQPNRQQRSQGFLKDNYFH